MPTRRRYLAVAGAAALAGCGFTVEQGTLTGDSGDGPTESEPGTDSTRTGSPTPPLAFSTSAFEDGGSIPPEYTGAGADRSPPLTVESVPGSAETLAFVVDDPDASGFVHWLLWNVPADVAEIPADVPQEETVSALDDARQGTNGFGELGYRGPLPPEGDGPHTYRFTMSAVSTTLDLAAGADRGALESAIAGSVVDTHRITGEFER